MFSFKKPKRKLRVRKASTSSEDESHGESAVVRPGASLSFDGEEEGEEVFQVKKSSTSRRIIKQQKKKKDKGDLEPPVIPCIPKQISKHSTQIPSPVKQEESSSPSGDEQGYEQENDEDSEKSNGSQSWMLTGREAEALHLEEEDEEDANDQQKSTNNNDDHTIKKILQKGAIPDAAAIHAARKAREAARLRGESTGNGNGDKPPPGNDYISLASDKRSSCGGKSRLVRDDDHDDDGENERVAFNGLHSESTQRVLDRKKLQEEYEDEEEIPEEDLSHWEEQQIRKVVGKNSTAPRPVLHDMDLDEEPDKQTSSLLDLARDNVISKPLKSYNLEGIRSRIRDRLKSMEEVQRRHTLDMDKAVDDLIESQSEIKRIEKKMPELASRHQFFQELRGYVNDLVECFNEKLINIKYLEEKMNKSKSDILSKLMERRRQDVRDQMIELSTKKPLSQVTMDQSEDVEESQRIRRAAEREGRRRRRRELRNKQSGLKGSHDDGLSSDDELSSLDTANISKMRKEVENTARTILSDVVEEFSTICGISHRLNSWKEEDFDSYNDAYMSLCLPKIFSPLVRLQLLFWNPLTEHTTIEAMDWYKALAVYSYRHGEDIESLKKDPDKRLIPSLVEKVLIPKATGLIKASYDPTSHLQTTRLVAFINKMYLDYPSVVGDSKQVRQLLTTVKEKIQASVDNDIYIPLGYSKNLLETTSSGHSQFFHRQFWSCFKLFKNILAWYELLSDSVLSQLAITSILNRYLLIALGINPDPLDSLTKARSIVNAFPSEFLRSMKGQESDLKRLSQFLVGLPSMRKGGMGRETLVEIARLLKTLQFKEESETFKRSHKL